MKDKEEDFILKDFINEIKNKIYDSSEPNKEKDVNFFYFNKEVVEIRKIMVMYINVGQLSTDKVDQYINKLHANYVPFFEKLPKDVGLIFIPVREPRMTSVELINF